MIRFLEGKVRFADLHATCIDVGGVGYDVRMPLGDLARLAEKDTPASVHVHTVVKEDALELYGFIDADAHTMFARLLSVSGVGPKSALAILSGLSVDDLIGAVLSGDEARLTKAPGVGKKTAARIILELKDRLQKDGLVGSRTTSGKTTTTRVGSVRHDVESALANLGYRPVQIDRAMKSIDALIDDGKELPVLLREALKHV
jgi:Holliday junction DNA helicase RuvA